MIRRQFTKSILALGATCGTGDGANAFLGKPVSLDVLVGRWARHEAQRYYTQKINSVQLRRAFDPETEAVCKGKPGPDM